MRAQNRFFGARSTTYNWNFESILRIFSIYYIAIGDKRYSSLITNALLFVFSGEMCTGAMCTGAMCTGAMCTSEICTDEMYW